MKSKSRPNVFLGAAVILLCLVLVSAHFTAGIFAKLVSNATGADDGGAAGFRVDAELTPAEGDGAYTLKLVNDSDVAVCCDVKITLEKTASGTVKYGDETVTFTDTDSVLLPGSVDVAPHASSAPMELTVTLDSGAGTEEHFTDRSNDTTSGSDESVAFAVVVSCTQVD